MTESRSADPEPIGAESHQSQAAGLEKVDQSLLGQVEEPLSQIGEGKMGDHPQDRGCQVSTGELAMGDQSLLRLVEEHQSVDEGLVDNDQSLGMAGKHQSPVRMVEKHQPQGEEDQSPPVFDELSPTTLG